MSGSRGAPALLQHVCKLALTAVHTLQKEVPLGMPDVLVCSVGTEIFFEKSGDGGRDPEPDKKWIGELDHDWDRAAVEEAAASFNELKPQVIRLSVYKRACKRLINQLCTG